MKFKKGRASIRDMARRDTGRPPPLSSQRLALLLEQMEEQAGKRPGTRAPRGTRAEIARKTGLDPAIVSDFLNATRDNVKAETIETVRGKLGLDPTWFSDEWSDGRVRRFTEYLKSNLKRARVDVQRSGGTDFDGDEEDDLQDLRPTEHELRRWERHLKKHRYPRVDAALKRAFILGMREPPVQASVDAAVNKMAEDFANENAAKRNKT